MREHVTRRPEDRGHGVWWAAVAALAMAFPAHGDTLDEAPSVAVGFGKVDITPSHPVRLNGYGARDKEADEVAASIHARAMAIGSDGSEHGPVVMVTVDNCAVPDHVTERVFEALTKDRAELYRERFVVASTHTHAAPYVTGSIPAIFGEKIPPAHRKHIERYTRTLTDKLVAVAEEALSSRAPAKVGWARGKVGFANNRREEGGPTDHALPTLFAIAPDGELRGVLTRYTCHATTTTGGDNRIHGDWPGFAADAIEKAHEGAVALVAIGAAGDQNPKPRGKLSLAKKHGRSVAKEVDRLLAGELRPLKGPPRARFTRVDLPLEELPDRSHYEKLARGGNPRVAYYARRQLKKLDSEKKKLPTSVPYPVGVWRFGDKLAMVFLGGEVVVDYARRMADAFDAERLWINAYCNAVPCYIPSKRVLKEGGYEADRSMMWYDKPTQFSPAVEDKVIHAVQRLLPPDFYSEAKQKEQFPPAKSPEQSMASMNVRPGMEVQLAAGDSLVADPIAIEFGRDGRLWVLEQRDYPLGMDNELRYGGRVKVLEDTDGDGRYDRGHVFVDGLPFPTGLMRWRDGLLICAAPDVLFVRDTDGDGRADQRKVLLTDFPTYNYHARVSSPRWGLDNRVHFANGRAAKKIRNVVKERKVDVSGHDFRLDPDTGRLETVSGHSQYGRVRDDWGEWFGAHNSHILFHYPLKSRYLSRSSDIAPPRSRSYPADDRKQRERVYPVGKGYYRATRADHTNRITSAGGICIYRDTLLGEGFAHNAFTCAPSHNLVTRRVLERTGATFSAHRAEGKKKRAFLAAADNWFRPVQARTGPDGALWVVDMYRFVIEHPDYMPKQRLEIYNIRAGAGRGRIYRVLPEGREPRAVPDLTDRTTAELARALDTRNGPLRDTIHQMLYEREDKAAVEPLEQVVRTADVAAARAQALCALDGLSSLSDDVLLTALRDDDPRVRRHAVRLSQGRVKDTPALADAVVGLASRAKSAEAMEIAHRLGELESERAGRALGRLAVEHAGSRYIAFAAMASATDHIDAVLPVVLDAAEKREEAREMVGRLLDLVVSRENEPAVATLLNWLGRRDDGAYAVWRFQMAEKLVDALRRKGTSLRKLRSDGGRSLRKGVEKLDRMVAAARSLVGDPDAATRRRLAAVPLLGHGLEKREEDRERLATLLRPEVAPRVQAAAVSALGRFSHESVPTLLLNDWSSHTPRLRRKIVSTLLTRTAWVKRLLDRMEREPAIASGLAPSNRQQLLEHNADAIRKRAKAILGDGKSRAEVLKRYQSVDPSDGEPKKGRKVFGNNCAVCHRIRDLGKPIGPDLTDLADQSAERLLTAILDPNRAVDPEYISYQVTLEDGRTLLGTLEDETANSVTLVGLDGETRTFLRSEIETLRSTGTSLMPEGLEENIPPGKMADLLAYLQDLGPEPKDVAGNEPSVVGPEDDGSYRLLASKAEIYGDTITYSSDARAITRWTGKGDRLAWTLDAERAGRYSIELVWASDNPNGVNRFALESPQTRWTSPIPGTGGLDRYRKAYFGYLQLEQGRQRVTLKPLGKVDGPLMNLREVRLYWAPDRPRRPSDPEERRERRGN